MRAVLDVPPRSPAEFFPAEVARAESAEHLFSFLKFSDLPSSCLWQDENQVLSERFYAKATNLASTSTQRSRN